MKNIVVALLSLSLNFAYAGHVIDVTSNQLQDIFIQNKKDKILVFFATWCSHCKLITLSKTLPKDKMVFISVDKNPETIKEFAKEMQYDVYHIIPSDDLKNLVTLSESLGIKFTTIDNDGIASISMPYIAYLDKDNKVLEDGIKSEDLPQYLN